MTARLVFINQLRTIEMNKNNSKALSNIMIIWEKEQLDLLICKEFQSNWEKRKLIVGLC
jgi:hypothetical protein